MSDIRDEYDFSKGKRGIFYVPQDEIRIPHYLSEDVERKLGILAEKKHISRDDVLNMVLENELDILLKIAH